MKSTLPGTIKLAIIIIALLPYIIAFAPNPADSSSNSFEIAGGAGSFADVSRDCNGRVLNVTDYPYNDVGISFDHHWPKDLRVGAKAGYYSEAGPSSTTHATSENEFYTPETPVPPRTIRYINPNVGFGGSFAHLDLGIVFFSNQQLLRGGYYSSDLRYFRENSAIVPSVQLRLGNLNAWYFSTSYYNNLPIMTGGGIFDLGLGFNLGRPQSNLWLGLGGGVYDGIILSSKVDIPIRDYLFLHLRASGNSGDANQYGLSGGLKIIF